MSSLDPLETWAEQRADDEEIHLALLLVAPEMNAGQTGGDERVQHRMLPYRHVQHPAARPEQQHQQPQKARALFEPEKLLHIPRMAARLHV